MREPWLTHVLQGRKTIESRFTKVSVAPHGVVSAGDLLLFKRAAGPVCATAEVTAAHSHDLRRESAGELRERYGQALCADDRFWEERADARYATLIHLSAVHEVPELHLDKHDRRGWVVLNDTPRVHANQLQLSGLSSNSVSPRPVVVIIPPSTGENPAQLILPGLRR